MRHSLLTQLPHYTWTTLRLSAGHRQLGHLIITVTQPTPPSSTGPGLEQTDLQTQGFKLRT